ncbi:MAG TPA: ketopantoate reductase C-terminal domain-containing protein [Candidatus Elarobacter sp.]|nr:ketopantoate reductase C-terminal domain-containing protein [Candidatus Elarobacter sp.]
MHVYVVGRGAVGMYLGELLRGIGNAVTYAPRALDAVERVDADMVLVTVKAYDTAGAVETLRRALADDGGATIVTPQNGVGNEEILASAFGAGRVVAAALTVPVEIGPGGIGVAARGGGIAFAPVGTSSANNWLLAAFGATGLEVRAVEDYRSLKWSKLALNVVANAACAILDELPAELVRRRTAFDLDLRQVREVAAVMKAQRIAAIDLPRYPVRALFAVASAPLPAARAILGSRIARARGAKPPSLLLDLRAGRGRTEADALNGAVARAAREASVAAPVNATYARVLDEIARAPERWDAYRGRPDALAAAVASASKGPPSS